MNLNLLNIRVADKFKVKVVQETLYSLIRIQDQAHIFKIQIDYIKMKKELNLVQARDKI